MTTQAQTQTQALPAELQAVISAKQKRRVRPVQISGLVKPDLRPQVIDALEKGVTPTDLLNVALAALFNKEEK